MRSRSLHLLFTLLAALTAGCGGPPRLALEPVPLQDDDRYDIPEPKFRVRDDYYDLIDYTFFKQAEQVADVPRDFRKLAGKPKQAGNLTPLDEVQDSSWYTNRMRFRTLSAAEIRQGPNRAQGPDLEHPWTVVAGKTQGVTPGFTIEDARGDRFVIKFDPITDLELATGAEAIGTRLFWAAGYNTPENYLVHFRPELLQIGPKATVRLQLNRKRPMTPADLDLILSKVQKQPDGTLRCIASRFLKGKPLGPIPFIGVRRDDGNDVIPHEHRRELRGYKVFAAWLNHNDCREINSLDMYVEDEGRHYVRHYLIDFGATLGSASTGPNMRSEGSEYQLDLGAMTTSALTLGLHERPWLDIEFPKLRGVGLFEAQHYDPASWKQNYPLPPFENTTPRDGFWASKIIARFDDELLRAAVETAEFSDPAAADYMVRTLAERRDRTVRYWFGRVNPLDEFEIVSGPSAASAAADPGGGLARQILGASQPGVPPGAAKPGDSAATTKPGGPPGAPALRFEDLGVRYAGIAPRRYAVRITTSSGKQIESFEVDARDIPLAGVMRATDSAEQDADRLVRVVIRSAAASGRATGRATWTKPVTVTLYRHPSGTLRVAAIERDE